MDDNMKDEREDNNVRECYFIERRSVLNINMSRLITNTKYSWHGTVFMFSSALRYQTSLPRIYNPRGFRT